MLSETVQLEQLINEKTGQEEESRRLDEEQKQLKLRAKALCEKIVQELKKKNSEKQQAVNQLQSRIGNLEAQLSTLSPSGHEPTPTQETEIKEAEKAAEADNEGFKEDIPDENVTIAEVEEEIEASDKKKHKFF